MNSSRSPSSSCSADPSRTGQTSESTSSSSSSSSKASVGSTSTETSSSSSSEKREASPTRSGLSGATNQARGVNDGLPDDDGDSSASSWEELERRVSKRRKASGFVASKPAKTKFLSAGPLSAADARRATRARNPAPNQDNAGLLGQWQQHTTGIGSKLLAKMGFSGRLGKYEQGIAQPIEQRVRQGKQGIQENESLPNIKSKASNGTKRAEEDYNIVRRVRGQKRGTFALKMELERKFAMFEKGILASGTNELEPSNNPGEVLHHDRATESLVSTGPVRELLDNILVLVSRYENEAAQLDDSLKRKRAKLEALKRRRLDIKSGASSCRETLDAVNDLSSVVQGLDDARSLQEFANVAVKVHTGFSTNASSSLKEQLNLHHSRLQVPPVVELLYGMAKPKVIEELRLAFEPKQEVDSSWLSEPRDSHAKIVASCLTKLALIGGDRDGASYNKLLVMTVLRSVRDLLPRSNPGDAHADELARALTHIRSALSEAFANLLAEDVVLPWLQARLDRWDPQSDPVSPHVWVFPWLPVFGKHKIRALFTPFASRVSGLMSGWNARDPSVVNILDPWLPVARQIEIDHFLERHVVGPVARLLQSISSDELAVCSSAGNCRSMRPALRWHGFMQDRALARLFLENLFPQWLRALYEKLSLAIDHKSYGRDVSASNNGIETGSAMQSATQWYVSWKSGFPGELGKTPELSAGFLAGLDVMNAAVDHGIDSLAGSEVLSFLDARVAEIRADSLAFTLNTSTDTKQYQPSRSRAQRESANPRASTKDVVAHAAAANQLVFASSGGNEAGYVLYSLNHVSLYFDSAQQGVIMARVPPSRIFNPISLEDLIALASTSSPNPTYCRCAGTFI